MTEGEKARVEWIDRQARAGEEEYFLQCDTTGSVCSLETWAERDKKIAQTEMLSVAVAERIERLEIPGGGYHDGESLQIVSAHTGQVKRIPNFRRCNWIPYTAQQKRNGILNALIYFVLTMKEKPGIGFRHICIHDGDRCRHDELVGRWRVQGKRINSWNKRLAKKFGAFFIFRSHEAGSPVKKSRGKVKDRKTGKQTRPYILDENGDRILCTDEEGEQTWHPHTHAVLMKTRRISDAEWGELIKALKRHFGVVFPDHGELREPREACKYLVKCDELMNCDDKGFKNFILSTKGARLVSCLGPFAKFRKQLDLAGRKVIIGKDPDSANVEYKVIKNWNGNPASRVSELTEGEELVRNIQREIEEKPGPLQRPAMIARMAPQQIFTPIAEPTFMVRGNHVDIEEFYRRPQIARIRAFTLDDFEAGCAVFRAQFGMSVEAWLSQGHAAAQAASIGVDLRGKQPEFGDILTPSEAALEGSAHNTPVTGTHPTPSKPPGGKCERSEAPIGRPKAVSSNQSGQLFPEEPPGAADRSPERVLAGSPCPLSEESPDGRAPPETKPNQTNERTS